MKRASCDTIDNHYRDIQPGPMHHPAQRSAYRSGWQTCENQID